MRQKTVNDLAVGRSVDETLRLVKAFQVLLHSEILERLSMRLGGTSAVLPNLMVPLELLTPFELAHLSLQKSHCNACASLALSMLWRRGMNTQSQAHFVENASPGYTNLRMGSEMQSSCLTCSSLGPGMSLQLHIAHRY